MNKLISLLSLIVLTSVTFAQEKKKKENRQQEVAITFRNIDYFGITYRIGKANALWRFQAISVSGNYNGSFIGNIDNYTGGVGVNTSVGREYRKPITDQFELRYGLDLSLSYNFGYNLTNGDTSSTSYDDTQSTYGIGSKLVLGFNYVTNNNIIIGAEILPGIQYYYTEYKTTANGNTYNPRNDAGLNFDITNTRALLSVGYRF